MCLSISFKLLNWSIWNITFTLVQLFIDHPKVSDKFGTSDLGLDLQGQICHESLNVCVIPCECDNFWPVWIYLSNLNSILFNYIIYVSDEFETANFNSFWKKWTVSHYNFKLELWIDHLLVLSRGGFGAGGGDTCFLRMPKKSLTSSSLNIQKIKILLPMCGLNYIDHSCGSVGSVHVSVDRITRITGERFDMRSWSSDTT